MGWSSPKYWRCASGAGRKKLEGDAVTKSVQFRLNAEQAAIVKQFVKMLKAGEITLDDFKKE